MTSPVTAGVGMAEEVRRPPRALADALRGRTVSAPTGGGEGFDDLRLLLDDGTVCVILGAAVSDARRGRPTALPPHGELKAVHGRAGTLAVRPKPKTTQDAPDTAAPRASPVRGPTA